MTNREWLSTLTDLELSMFIYRTLIHDIGTRYSDSIYGVASWLNEEHSEEYMEVDKEDCPLEEE